MMRTKIGIAVVGCLLLLGWTHQVKAGIVTWGVEGTVIQITDPENVLQGQVLLGSPFSLEFAYEQTVPKTNPEDDRGGIYLDAIVTSAGSIGSLLFTTATGINEIVSGDARTRSIFQARSSIILQGDIMVSSIALSGPSGFFPQDMLPLVPPEDLFLSVNGIFEIFGGSQPLLVSANITRIVPEPTTLTLLSFSILAGAFVHRRNKNTTKH